MSNKGFSNPFSTMKIFVKLKGAGNCLRVGNKLVTPHAWEEVDDNENVRYFLNRGVLIKQEPSAAPANHSENESVGAATNIEPAESENDVSPTKKRAKK